MRDQGPAARQDPVQDAQLGLPVPAQRRRLLRPVRAGRAQPPRRRRSAPHTTRRSSTTRRASSTCSAPAAVYLGLETLPSAQNIASPKNILSLEAGAKYTNTRKALGGVDHEKGIAWRALADLDYADSKAFPKLYGGVDYGVPLPLPNSSFWLYAHAGMAWGQRAHPLAAFYFGSFRNNYVDDRPEKRYREMESFPGFEIDEIAAAASPS